MSNIKVVEIKARELKKNQMCIGFLDLKNQNETKQKQTNKNRTFGITMNVMENWCKANG